MIISVIDLGAVMREVNDGRVAPSDVGTLAGTPGEIGEQLRHSGAERAIALAHGVPGLALGEDRQRLLDAADRGDHGRGAALLAAPAAARPVALRLRRAADDGQAFSVTSICRSHYGRSGL